MIIDIPAVATLDFRLPKEGNKKQVVIQFTTSPTAAADLVVSGALTEDLAGRPELVDAIINSCVVESSEGDLDKLEVIDRIAVANRLRMEIVKRSVAISVAGSDTSGK